MGAGILFLNPLLAAGVGLAAAPIIIHWLSRRRYRRVAWAAMTFLLEAERQNRRRVRLEQWLLLALRCLSIGLIALVFARPYLRPGWLTALAGTAGGAQRIIILDDSASLNYRTDAGTEFERLRDGVVRLSQLLALEHGQDAVTVLLTSRPKSPLVAEAHFTPSAQAQLVEKLRAVVCSHTRAEPQAALQQAAELVTSSAAGSASEIYCFSDFQRNAWAGGTSRPFATLDGLDPRRVRVALVHVGSEPRPNVAVKELRLERVQTIVGLPSQVRVQIANYGREVLRNVALRVAVDGTPEPPALIAELPVGQAADTLFEVTLREEGPHEITAELPVADRFTVDDIGRLSVQAQTHLPVLVVNGHPAAEAALDAARVLRAALAPAGPFTSGMHVEVVEASEFEALELDRYGLVIMSNCQAPSEILAAALRRYVDAGGGLLIALGSEVVGDDYNRVLGPGGTDLLPAALEAPRSPPGGAALVRLVPGDLTNGLSAGGDATAELTHFFTYLSSTVAAPTSATSQAAGVEVVAKFADETGTPALLERVIGRGRVVLFTSSLDLAWNNWAQATDGSFVVSMLDWAQHCARRASLSGGYVAGAPGRITLNSERYLGDALLRGDTGAGEKLAARPAADGRSFDVELPIGPRCGFQRLDLRRRDGMDETWPLAVNVDPLESDLAVCQPSDLDAALGQFPHELIEVDQARIGPQDERLEYWPALLSIALVLLFAEQYLAWRLGQPGRL